MKYLEIHDEKVPALGLGTWELLGQDCVDAVRDAIQLGYRHIDTAEAYDNEKAVGRGIKDSGVSRNEIFLVTKVWPENLEPKRLRRSAETSLRKLDTDYVDLLLIHWPNPGVELERSVEAMLELQDEGKARHLGVSNFTPSLVEEAREYAPLFCNQVECHPYLAQEKLRRQAQGLDLMLTAYSPLARGTVADDETLTEIGTDHGKSPAQVALRWQMQRDPVAAIPRSSSAERRKENFEIFDFELSDGEMERIAGLASGKRLIDPSFAPEWES
ncbi:MAG: aldo/keto reductase [Gemmatimonadetes bacterium]|uniref:Aldo/keto reductase n=1 Tax=Candidatus Kutchimonas denitrificans TaxID=3056748 RepID=A0AAE4Z626_9BACT|nr:aldo/keto reductase [Gemmatimonadota bacterium]NIR74029.1 aldo/keto reductase [Candidatus Kutchimonas denitrificans]NIS03018.1 aldo/keto reductase [Gemmatimonadota bacterium]NIT68735.1 aldo/keto reductase [Gemmatimonadota bacterium]NIU53316.1 aldo/keto reductase [Gemmatimonadota bacterium]